MAYPHDPGVLEAPTRATESGANKYCQWLYLLGSAILHHTLLNFDQNYDISLLPIGYLTGIAESYFSTGLYPGRDFHP